MKTYIILFFAIFFNSLAFSQVDNEILFEADFNGNFQDHSEGQLNPNISGEVSLTTNRLGEENTAAYFSGEKDSYLNFGQPDHLKDLNEFSISLWFQGGTFELGDYEGLITFFEYYIGLYDLNTPLAVGIWDDDWNHNAFDWTNNEYYPDYDSTSWHHLVLVKATDSSYLYRDNVLRGKKPGYSIFWENTDSVIVGKSYKGAIDDLRIYSGALNQQEIDQLFNDTDVITGINSDSPDDRNSSFYPNPVQNQINFNTYSSIKILDSQGLIQQQANNVKSMDVSHLRSGIYFVIVNDGKPLKLIKK